MDVGAGKWTTAGAARTTCPSTTPRSTSLCTGEGGKGGPDGRRRPERGRGRWRRWWCPRGGRGPRWGWGAGVGAVARRRLRPRLPRVAPRSDLRARPPPPPRPRRVPGALKASVLAPARVRDTLGPYPPGPHAALNPSPAAPGHIQSSRLRFSPELRRRPCGPQSPGSPPPPRRRPASTPVTLGESWRGGESEAPGVA